MKKELNLNSLILYQNPINNDLINNHISLSLRNKRKTVNTESGISDLIYQRKSKENRSLIQRKNKRFGNFHHISPAPQHP
jgi:hypothetical protein